MSQVPGLSEVLTTGQVAKLCRVAPRTAAKWIDAGLLPGYRIPGSADRRVRRNDLLMFMGRHGMQPHPSFNSDDTRLKDLIAEVARLGCMVDDLLNRRPFQ